MKNLALVSIPLIAATLLPAAATAQKPGLPPGVYFIWSPPGPNTTTPDHPYLPNTDYVRDQSHMNVNAARMPAAGDGARPAADNPTRVLNLTWCRIATAAEGATPPDLHQGGADIVKAGGTAELWFGNERVTKEDSAFVTASIFRISESGETPVAVVQPAAPVPPGRWGSKTALSLGTLPAGEYVVRIRIIDRALGLDDRLERRVEAR